MNQQNTIPDPGNFTRSEERRLREQFCGANAFRLRNAVPESVHVRPRRDPSSEPRPLVKTTTAPRFVTRASKSIETFACAHCGKPYNRIAKNQKFCHDDCCRDAYYKSKNEKRRAESLARREAKAK